MVNFFSFQAANILSPIPWIGHLLSLYSELILISTFPSDPWKRDRSIEKKSVF